MQPHTLWSEILQVAEEAKKSNADLLITLGAGSLTDGAKIIALVGKQKTTTARVRTLTGSGNGK